MTPYLAEPRGAAGGRSSNNNIISVRRERPSASVRPQPDSATGQQPRSAAQKPSIQALERAQGYLKLPKSATAPPPCLPPSRWRPARSPPRTRRVGGASSNAPPIRLAIRSALSEKTCPPRSSTERRHISTPAEINSTTLSSPKAISTRLPDARPAAVAPFKAECFPDKWPAIDRRPCRKNRKRRDAALVLARLSENSPYASWNHLTRVAQGPSTAPLPQKFRSLSAN